MEFIFSMVIILSIVSVSLLAAYIVRIIKGQYLGAGINLGLFLITSTDVVRILFVHGVLKAPAIKGLAFDKLLWDVGLAGCIIFAFCVILMYVANTCASDPQVSLKSKGAIMRKRAYDRSRNCHQTFNKMTTQMNVSSSSESQIAHDTN